MHFSPEEFEKQIYRINKLIEETGAEVAIKWRDYVPDLADGQDREVDISIRKDGRLTFVECRHRSRPQDKLWIEQLAGKRKLLNADAVIAVSSSGFSKGAVAAAEYLGVHSRQLAEVSIQEARGWSDLSTVFASFVQFQHILFKILIRGKNMSTKQPVLRNEKGDVVHFHDLAIQLAEKFHEKLSAINNPHSWHQFKSSPLGGDGLLLDGVPVAAINVEFTARLVTKPQVLSAVYDYGPPPPDTRSEATVEKTEDGISEWVKSENRAEWHLDLSSLTTPENSVFKTIATDHGKPMVMNRFSIRFGKDFRRSTLDEITLEIHSD